MAIYLPDGTKLEGEESDALEKSLAPAPEAGEEKEDWLSNLADTAISIGSGAANIVGQLPTWLSHILPDEDTPVEEFARRANNPDELNADLNPTAIRPEQLGNKDTWGWGVSSNLASEQEEGYNPNNKTEAPEEARPSLSDINVASPTELYKRNVFKDYAPNEAPETSQLSEDAFARAKTLADEMRGVTEQFQAAKEELSGLTVNPSKVAAQMGAPFLELANVMQSYYSESTKLKQQNLQDAFYNPELKGMAYWGNLWNAFWNNKMAVATMVGESLPAMAVTWANAVKVGKVFEAAGTFAKIAKATGISENAARIIFASGLNGTFDGVVSGITAANEAAIEYQKKYGVEMPTANYWSLLADVGLTTAAIDWTTGIFSPENRMIANMIRGGKAELMGSEAAARGFVRKVFGGTAKSFGSVGIEGAEEGAQNTLEGIFTRIYSDEETKPGQIRGDFASGFMVGAAMGGPMQAFNIASESRGRQEAPEQPKAGVAEGVNNAPADTGDQGGGNPPATGDQGGNTPNTYSAGGVDDTNTGEDGPINMGPGGPTYTVENGNVVGETTTASPQPNVGTVINPDGTIAGQQGTIGPDGAVSLPGQAINMSGTPSNQPVNIQQEAAIQTPGANEGQQGPAEMNPGEEQENYLKARLGENYALENKRVVDAVRKLKRPLTQDQIDALIYLDQAVGAIMGNKAKLGNVADVLSTFSGDRSTWSERARAIAASAKEKGDANGADMWNVFADLADGKTLPEALFNFQQGPDKKYTRKPAIQQVGEAPQQEAPVETPRTPGVYDQSGAVAPTATGGQAIQSIGLNQKSPLQEAKKQAEAEQRKKPHDKQGRVIPARGSSTEQTHAAAGAEPSANWYSSGAYAQKPDAAALTAPVRPNAEPSQVKHVEPPKPPKPQTAIQQIGEKPKPVEKPTTQEKSVETAKDDERLQKEFNDRVDKLSERETPASREDIINALIRPGKMSQSEKRMAKSAFRRYLVKELNKLGYNESSPEYKAAMESYDNSHKSPTDAITTAYNGLEKLRQELASREDPKKVKAEAKEWYDKLCNMPAGITVSLQVRDSISDMIKRGDYAIARQRAKNAYYRALCNRFVSEDEGLDKQAGHDVFEKDRDREEFYRLYREANKNKSGAKGPKGDRITYEDAYNFLVEKGITNDKMLSKEFASAVAMVASDSTIATTKYDKETDTWVKDTATIANSGDSASDLETARSKLETEAPLTKEERSAIYNFGTDEDKAELERQDDRYGGKDETEEAEESKKEEPKKSREEELAELEREQKSEQVSDEENLLSAKQIKKIERNEKAKKEQAEKKDKFDISEEEVYGRSSDNRKRDDNLDESKMFDDSQKLVEQQEKAEEAEEVDEKEKPKGKKPKDEKPKEKEKPVVTYSKAASDFTKERENFKSRVEQLSLGEISALHDALLAYDKGLPTNEENLGEEARDLFNELKQYPPVAWNSFLSARFNEKRKQKKEAAIKDERQQDEKWQAEAEEELNKLDESKLDEVQKKLLEIIRRRKDKVLAKHKEFFDETAALMQYAKQNGVYDLWVSAVNHLEGLNKVIALLHGNTRNGNTRAQEWLQKLLQAYQRPTPTATEEVIKGYLRDLKLGERTAETDAEVEFWNTILGLRNQGVANDAQITTAAPNQNAVFDEKVMARDPGEIANPGKLYTEQRRTFFENNFRGKDITVDAMLSDAASIARIDSDYAEANRIYTAAIERMREVNREGAKTAKAETPKEPAFKQKTVADMRVAVEAAIKREIGTNPKEVVHKGQELEDFIDKIAKRISNTFPFDRMDKDVVKKHVRELVEPQLQKLGVKLAEPEIVEKAAEFEKENPPEEADPNDNNKVIEEVISALPEDLRNFVKEAGGTQNIIANLATIDAGPAAAAANLASSCQQNAEAAANEADKNMWATAAKAWAKIAEGIVNHEAAEKTKSFNQKRADIIAKINEGKAPTQSEHNFMSNDSLGRFDVGTKENTAERIIVQRGMRNKKIRDAMQQAYAYLYRGRIANRNAKQHLAKTDEGWAPVNSNRKNNWASTLAAKGAVKINKIFDENIAKNSEYLTQDAVEDFVKQNAAKMSENERALWNAVNDILHDREFRNDIKFMVSEPRTTPMSGKESNLRKALYKVWGKVVIDALEKAGKLKFCANGVNAFVACAADIAGGDAVATHRILQDMYARVGDASSVAGFFDPRTGAAYINTDFATAENVNAIIAHEIGVHMARDSKFRETIDPVIKEGAGLIRAEAANGDPICKRALEAFKHSPEQSDEELVAYFVGEYTQAKGLVRPKAKTLIGKIFNAIRDFLKRVLGIRTTKSDQLAAFFQNMVFEMAMEKRGDGVPAVLNLGGIPMFMTGWHGSPHDFERFSLSAIGTGEGAQAHGWGLYFASLRSEAEHYRDALSKNYHVMTLKLNSPGGLASLFYKWRENRNSPIKGWSKERISNAVKKATYNGAYDFTNQFTLKHQAPYIKEGLLADAKHKLSTAETIRKSVVPNGKAFTRYKQEQIKQFEEEAQICKDSAVVVDMLISGKYRVEYESKRGVLFKVDLPEEDVMLTARGDAYIQAPKVLEALGKIEGWKYAPLFAELSEIYKKKGLNPWFATSEDPEMVRTSISERGPVKRNRTSKYMESRYLDYYSRKDNPLGEYVDRYAEILNQLQVARLDNGYAIYNSLRKLTGSAKEASLLLNRYGVEGLAYQTNDGYGTTDYVVWNEQAIKILEKNGQPVNPEPPKGDGPKFMVGKSEEDAKTMSTLNKAFLEKVQNLVNRGEIHQGTEEQIMDVVRSIAGGDKDFADLETNIREACKDSKAFYDDRTKKIYLPSNNLSSDEAVGVLSHEAFHALFDNKNENVKNFATGVANYFFSNKMEGLYDLISIPGERFAAVKSAAREGAENFFDALMQGKIAKGNEANELSGYIVGAIHSAGLVKDTSTPISLEEWEELCTKIMTGNYYPEDLVRFASSTVQIYNDYGTTENGSNNRRERFTAEGNEEKVRSTLEANGEGRTSRLREGVSESEQEKDESQRPNIKGVGPKFMVGSPTVTDPSTQGVLDREKRVRAEAEKISKPNWATEWIRKTFGEEAAIAFDTVMGVLKKIGYHCYFTNQLCEAASKFMPAMKDFAKSYARHAARRGELERASDAIYARWKQLNQKDRDAVDNFLYENQMNYDGKWGYVPDWLPAESKNPKKTKSLQQQAREKLDPELQKMYEALSDKAKQVVDEVYHHGWDTLQLKRNGLNALRRKFGLEERTVYNRLGPAPYAPLMRYGEHQLVWMSFEFAKLDNEKRTLEGTESLTDEQEDRLAKLRTQVDEMKSNADHYYVERFDSSLKAQLARSKMEHARVNDNGEPLGYAVAYPLVENTPQGMNFMQRNAVAENLKAKIFEQWKDSKMAQVMIRAIDEMVEEVETANVHKDTKQRKHVSGASRQMMDSFSRKGKMDASMIANLEYGHDAIEDLNKCRSQNNYNRRFMTPADITDSTRMLNEITSRFNESSDYKPDGLFTKMANTLRGWTGFRMLATNPSYYLHNALQPTMMTFPELAGRFGAAAASEEFNKAYKEYFATCAKGINSAKGMQKLRRFGSLVNDLKKRGLTQREADMLTDMVNLSQIDMGLDSEMGNISGNNPVTRAASRVYQATTDMSRGVEIMNRYVTAMTSFRLAYKQNLANGMTEEDAYNNARDYTHKVLYTTQGDYNAYNAPPVFNTALGKVALQFRKFQAIQIAYFVDQMHRAYGTKSKAEIAAMSDKEKENYYTERAIARSQLAWSLGVHFVMTGFKGLPAASTLLFLLGAAFGDDDEDGETWARRGLKNAGLDSTAINGFTNGVFSLLGLDLSSRVGANDMLSIAPFAKKELNEEGGPEYFLASAMGAGPGLVMRAITGFNNSHIWDAIQGYEPVQNMRPLMEAVLPHAITNTSKALGIIDVTRTSKTGQRILPEGSLGFGDSVLMALGYIAPDVNRNFQIWKAHKMTKDTLSQMKSDMIRRYNQGTNKSKELGRLATDVKKYNELAKKRNLATISVSDIVKQAKQKLAKEAKGVKQGMNVPAKDMGYINQLRQIY